MKRIFAILALLCLLLTGCAAPGPEIPDDPAPDVEQDPDPVPPVDPNHSSLYLPDIAVEDVILYFNEVCLDAEVNNGGNPTTHAGIYIGDGKFVHASSVKGEVMVSSLSSGYYRRVFSWARRLIE